MSLIICLNAKKLGNKKRTKGRKQKLARLVDKKHNNLPEYSNMYHHVCNV